MNKIKKSSVIILLVVVMVSMIAYMFKVGCVWKNAFEVECPTCGMTRAWEAFLHGRISEAFRYHPLFFTVPIIWVYIAFDGKVFRKNSINIFILSSICISFFVVYICKLL